MRVALPDKRNDQGQSGARGRRVAKRLNQFIIRQSGPEEAVAFGFVGERGKKFLHRRFVARLSNANRRGRAIAQDQAARLRSVLRRERNIAGTNRSHIFN